LSRSRLAAVRLLIIDELGYAPLSQTRATPRLSGYRSTPPDLAGRKLEQLDAIFRQFIHARGNQTNGERVSRRDFGF
jgi:hypothetical protein